MKNKKITYRHLILIKKLLIGIVFILIGLQSVITYFLAVTLESKKEAIALIIDNTFERITETHHSHLSYIEANIDYLVTGLKNVSSHDTQQDKSRAGIFHFFFGLYYEPLPSFNFLKKITVSQKFIAMNDPSYSFLWISELLHPPKISFI